MILLRLRSWMCGRRISTAGDRFPGAVNIPLDEFEERMESVDREKTVYVLCQYGGQEPGLCGEVE